MDVKETIKAYEKALSEHTWHAVKDFFHENAAVVFVEATYIGKKQVESAISKTFSMIRDENFEIGEIYWSIESELFACCTFEFEWAGTIHGKRFHNRGRGTIAWVKSGEKWVIVNQHFGPAVN